MTAPTATPDDRRWCSTPGIAPRTPGAPPGPAPSRRPTATRAATYRCPPARPPSRPRRSARGRAARGRARRPSGRVRTPAASPALLEQRGERGVGDVSPRGQEVGRVHELVQLLGDAERAQQPFVEHGRRSADIELCPIRVETGAGRLPDPAGDGRTPPPFHDPA